MVLTLALICIPCNRDSVQDVYTTASAGQYAGNTDILRYEINSVSIIEIP